jgi:predicted metalloprotease
MVGPHYCPLDSKIYLDETFFAQLQTRLGAQGGDVAEAYVMAHEVGHHVQNELGILNVSEDNEGSIATELQADCFAGLWLGSLKSEGILEEGEIREALDAASTVGDDNIQQRTQGEIQPESWTHGSSEERVQWFTAGYNGAGMESCM